MKKVISGVILAVCCLFVNSGVSFAAWQNVGTRQLNGDNVTDYIDNDIKDCENYCIVKQRAKFEDSSEVSEICATAAYKLKQVDDHKEVDTSKVQTIDLVYYDAQGEEITSMSQHNQYDENAWENNQETQVDDFVKKCYDERYNSLLGRISLLAQNIMKVILIAVLVFILIKAVM